MADSLDPTAPEEEPSGWHDVDTPTYLKEVTDGQFVNISIKGYEKKSSTGFPREEYYAFHIVSILTSADVQVPQDLGSLPSRQDSNRTRQEVWRRYSEFEALRHFLYTVYPHVVVPPLPEKTASTRTVALEHLQDLSFDTASDDKLPGWWRFDTCKTTNGGSGGCIKQNLNVQSGAGIYLRIKGSSGLLNKLTLTGEDSDFLLKRQQALELFLVRVSRHPILSRNYWFHQFLNNVGWREAAQQTGYAAKAGTLLQTLSLQLSKQRPDSRFQDVRQYADELEAVFKSLLEIRLKMNDSLRTVYKVHANYGRVFSEWSEVEGTLGTPLQIAGGCMDSYAESMDTYESEEELRFLLPLKEYVAYCDSLRQVVRRQEFLQHQLEKADEVLSAKAEAKNALSKENPESGGSGGSRFSLKAMATKLRGGDTSYEGRLAHAVRELQEAEDAMKQAQQELETFTKDALKDLERFNTQKIADFRSKLINYAQLQMHIHRKGINTWERMKQGFETL